MRLWLTTRQAALRVDVSERTINRWVSDGRLTAVTLDGTRYLHLPELLRCERERRGSRNLGSPGARVSVAS